MKYIFLLFSHLVLISLSACAQQEVKEIRNLRGDSVVVHRSKLYLIADLKEKIILQNMELHVWQNLQKIDSIWYGKDSLVLSFIAKNGTRSKKMKRTFGGDVRGIINEYKQILTRPLEDSIVTYYSDNGLLVYNEHWDETYKFENALQRTGNVSFYWKRMKYERFEYDNQNRVIKRLYTIPEGRIWVATFTYDAKGKATESGKWIFPDAFWQDKWVDFSLHTN